MTRDEPGMPAVTGRLSGTGRNHTDEPVSVPLAGLELITGERGEGGVLAVPAGDVRVLRD